MIHQMELYLGFKEKCRRVELLKHFEPGSTGDSLGLSRTRNCCDCCTRHLLGGGVEGRVATKIFEDFGGALNKAFIIGWEPVSNIHFTRPGTCINRQLH